MRYIKFCNNLPGCMSAAKCTKSTHKRSQNECVFASKYFNCSLICHCVINKKIQNP